MYVKSNRSWFKHLDFMLLDIITLELTLVLAFYLRHKSNFFNSATMYKELALAIVVLHIMILFFMEGYHGILKRGKWVELKQVLKHNVLLFAGMMTYMMVRKNTGEYSRMTLFLFLGISTVCVWIVRNSLKFYLIHRDVRKKQLQHMLLVTECKQAQKLVKKIRKNEFGITRLCGIVLLDGEETWHEIQGVPVVASREDMYEYARTHVVDEVLISAQDEDMESLMEGFLYMGITIHVDIGSMFDIKHGMVNHVNDVPVLTTSINVVTTRQLFIKRCIDICAGVVGTLIMLVVAVVVGPIIYAQSPGPIFFTQERVGKNGRKFRIIKFRSMYLDAEARKQELMAENEMEGLMFKMADDPRIIPIGRFIRRTSLDELPQFVNILLGDMSLVGTRPPTVDEYEQYDLKHKSRLATKPGLTGMWQVSGRSEITDFNEVVRLDNEYIRNWSLGLDVKLIWKTVGIVLKGQGAE